MNHFVHQVHVSYNDWLNASFLNKLRELKRTLTIHETLAIFVVAYMKGAC
jgi:hypothetical protein